MSISHSEQNFLAELYRRYISGPETLVAQGKLLRKLNFEAYEIEDRWNSVEELRIKKSDLPETGESFISWYVKKEKEMNEEIMEFLYFIENDALVEHVAYYVCMEELVDGSFDDLMALVQVGMAPACKMTAGSNYWDEMGRGDFSAIHTKMFSDSSGYLRGVLEHRGSPIVSIPKECYANGNLLLMWAIRREYNIRLVGAIGLIEGSAPFRFRATTTAMARLGLPESVIAYHRAHIEIDAWHSKAWLENVLSNYSCFGNKIVSELALGVQIRFNIAKDYYAKIFAMMREL